MKFRVVSVLFALLLLLLAVTVAAARGSNSAQLENAGWYCVNAGPNNWVHCNPPSVNMPEDLFEGNRKTIQVKVFSEDGSEFLGTEILVHEDIYNGQPCPQDGKETYDDLTDTFPYFACHHFDTGGG